MQICTTASFLINLQCNCKSGSACSARQALEGLKIKALFAFISKTEVTRGARRWSLDDI